MLRSPLACKYSPPVILGLSLFTVYLLTMAPGLTWANDGADGGDLTTAVVVGGIPHPTGYPTYLVLAGLFQKLPVGSPAFRCNLMSAVATVLAAVLLYLLVVRFLDPTDPTHYWLPGLLSGFAFGLSPLIWSQAVITEVYALQSLLITLVLYLWAAPTPKSIVERLCGLSLGLAMGNHLTTILLVPFVLVSKGAHRSWNRKSFLNRLVPFAVGLLIYLVLPLQADSNPPVNWGSPNTISRFWWLTSGRLYMMNLHLVTAGEVLSRIQSWAALLVQQWSVLGIILALIGLVHFFSPSPLYYFAIWQAMVFSGFAIIYRSSDSYIYLSQVCVSFSIWIGVGMARVMESGFLHQHRLSSAIGFMALIYLFGLAASHWSQVDASHDPRAEDFGRQIIESAPPDAIIFAKGDQAVFALWYFHFALHKRSDIIVIATDLLHFDWYKEDLHKTYPSLIVPGSLPWPETIAQANPRRTVCYVQYIDQTEIDCSKAPRPP